MAKEVMKPEVKAVSGYTDIFLMGISKAFTEQLIAATPVGNGTILSGAVKLGGTAILPGKGTVMKLVKNGLILDGVDDITTAILTKLAVGKDQSGDDW